MLENLLRKAGLTKSLILVSLVAVLLSVVLDVVLSLPLGRFTTTGLIIAGIIPALLTPLIGYYYFKILVRLESSERMVKQSLVEKEVLLKELHHRVKNNLATICSLINLQAVGVNDPSDKVMLDDLQLRIYSMAQVHEELYRSRDLTRVSFFEYAHNLSERVVRALSKDPGKISVAITGSDMLLDVGVLIPLGLIMNELLTNAIKHAFPGEPGGEITIHLSGSKGVLMLSLGDNGVGASREVELSGAETLGLKLVQTLVRQMKGSIEVYTTGGMRYTLTFPLAATGQTSAGRDVF